MQFTFLKKFVDLTDPTASLRHAMFALCMTSGVVYLGVDLVVGEVKRGVGITSEWNVAFGILLSAATTSKLVGQKLNNSAPPDEETGKE
jgi:hypothetical protein